MKRATEAEAVVLRPMCVMGVIVSSALLGLVLGTWGMLIFGPMWFIAVCMAAFVWLPPRPNPKPKQINRR